MSPRFAQAQRWRRLFTPLWLLLLLRVCTACADTSQGRVTFELWGEEYIEQGIPSAAFDDGWSVTYEQFLVVLGEITLDEGPAQAATLSSVQLFDLTTPGPHAVGPALELDSGAWRAVGYAILPADSSTRRHQSASSAALNQMRDGGYSVYVAGSAERDGESYTFAWGFDSLTRYTNCVDTRGGQTTTGIVVGDGTDEKHQLTLHGDHLFYDDLASSQAQLRFDALAQSDTDADWHISLAELNAVSLSDLPAEAGAYGVGAFDVNTLGEFVAGAVTNIGHFDGEGHCQAQNR